MARLRMLLPALFLTAAACGGGGGPRLFQPYDTCDTQNGDGCTNSFACVQSSLPAAAFTGDFCTVPCNVDADCPLVLNNFDTICYQGQCYIQCPQGGATCPYGQACGSYPIGPGAVVDLCTP